MGQQKVRQGLKTSAVMDLRQKLSGTMHSQPKQKDPQKFKQVKLDESVRTIKKNIQAATVAPAGIKNKAQKKVFHPFVLWSIYGLVYCKITEYFLLYGMHVHFNNIFAGFKES